MKYQQNTNAVGLFIYVVVLALIPCLSGCAAGGRPQALPAMCEHSLLAKTAPWSDLVLTARGVCGQERAQSGTVPLGARGGAKGCGRSGGSHPRRRSRGDYGDGSGRYPWHGREHRRGHPASAGGQRRHRPVRPAAPGQLSPDDLGLRQDSLTAYGASPPRRRGSRDPEEFWIPACAGMTV
jgi:hypothetical protein